MLRYLLAWVVMVFIAILNGALREFTYRKKMPELRAHQLSTLIGGTALGLFIWGVVRLWPPVSTGQAFGIGLLWVALTIAFEFAWGRIYGKHSWPRLLQDYNILKGRVWILLLIWIALAPALFYKLR